MSLPKTLESTAQALLACGKGLLAADESFPTIEKRFKDFNILSTEENRRAYREMLFTTRGLAEFISGVILRGQASAARSQPYYLDVTHPDANKGGVVEFLSKTLHILPEAIATLGDMPNDVMMFEKSGLSIAMGNASPEVQAQANFVTLSNEEDGFAHAMDKFVLPTFTSASAP